jgi:hypothetical protein
MIRKPKAIIPHIAVENQKYLGDAALRTNKTPRRAPSITPLRTPMSQKATMGIPNKNTVRFVLIRPSLQKSNASLGA